MRHTCAAVITMFTLLAASPVKADNPSAPPVDPLNTPEARVILEDIKSLREQMRPLREKMAADLRKLRDMGVDLKSLRQQIGGGPVSVK